MLDELVLKNRSYRRFYEDKRITMEELLSLIKAARLTPCGGNLQVIKYKLICDEKTNEQVFGCLSWAAYYKDWQGPVEGERPSAYILMVAPENVNAKWDEGIAGQTILLKAVEKGLGGCFIANIDSIKIAQIVDLPDNYRVDLCIALGYPKEKVVIDDISEGDSIKYYRDDADVHHVPKKRINDIII